MRERDLGGVGSSCVCAWSVAGPPERKTNREREEEGSSRSGIRSVTRDEVCSSNWFGMRIETLKI